MFRYVLLALKGCAMGMADVVPGVSGGTIAFISGIYSELIESIKSFNPTALKLLGRFEFRKFWRHINGSFLFSVLQGIGIAIFSLIIALPVRSVGSFKMPDSRRNSPHAVRMNTTISTIFNLSLPLMSGIQSALSVL